MREYNCSELSILDKEGVIFHEYPKRNFFRKICIKAPSIILVNKYKSEVKFSHNTEWKDFSSCHDKDFFIVYVVVWEDSYANIWKNSWNKNYWISGINILFCLKNRCNFSRSKSKRGLLVLIKYSFYISGERWKLHEICIITWLAYGWWNKGIYIHIFSIFTENNPDFPISDWFEGAISPLGFAREALFLILPIIAYSV